MNEIVGSHRLRPLHFGQYNLRDGLVWAFSLSKFGEFLVFAELDHRSGDGRRCVRLGSVVAASALQWWWFVRVKGGQQRGWQNCAAHLMRQQRWALSFCAAHHRHVTQPWQCIFCAAFARFCAANSNLCAMEFQFCAQVSLGAVRPSLLPLPSPPPPNIVC